MAENPPPAAPEQPRRIQTTYYGYEKKGQENYDSASAAGFGDRQNKLVPHYSVALSQPERQARFGVTGKSTGKEFEYNGKTYRDDDSTSYDLTNPRVDIYSPEGPQDSQPTQQPSADSTLSHQADALMAGLSQPDFELTRVDSGPQLGGHLGAVNV